MKKKTYLYKYARAPCSLSSTHFKEKESNLKLLNLNREKENKKPTMMMKNRRRRRKNNCKSLNEIWTKLTEPHPTCISFSLCALCTVLCSDQWSERSCTLFFFAFRCRWLEFFFFVILETASAVADCWSICFGVVLLGWAWLDFACQVCLCAMCTNMTLNQVCVRARTYLITYSVHSIRTVHSSTATWTVQYSTAVLCTASLTWTKYFSLGLTTWNTLFQLFYFAVCVCAHRWAQVRMRVSVCARRAYTHWMESSFYIYEWY